MNPVEPTGSEGRLAARRAIVRWAWRLFRREWPQQTLVLGLLTVAVGAAIGGASAAYNVAPVSSNATFGAATHLIGLDGSDPQSLDTDLVVAAEWFGTIDVIGRRNVPVPGSFDPIEYRSQDPRGPFSGPMLRMRDGHYPATGSEVAVTDEVATGFELDIGDSFALDGTSRTVVGVVENPSDLGDEFALVVPSPAEPPELVTVLVDTSHDRVLSFRSLSGGLREVGSRPGNEGAVAAAGVFGIATVVLVLVALVAAAGFVVIAQRRLRQLGMLAAIGATEKHLRLVTIANGALIGVVAAVVGATVGVVGWIAVAPLVEEAVGYRIDRFDVPWWLVVAGMGLAIASATAAAWWPARAVARTSIVSALSGRPPRPTSTHRSAALATFCLVVGVVCLVTAGDVADDTAVYWSNALLVVAGTVATVLGVLLAGPIAVRALAHTARRLPVTVRLPLRDLARYQTRSGAALAAITLVLGIPVATVIVTTASTHGADSGNLSDRQILVRAANVDGPFVPDPADVGSLQSGVDHIAAALDDPTVSAVEVAVDPRLPPDDRFDGRQAITLAERSGEGWNDLTLLYVATPQLVEHHGVDLDQVDPASILTSETGTLRVVGIQLAPGANRSDSDIATAIEPLTSTYSSLPGSFVTREGLRQRGWEPAGSGRWVIETPRPITSDQLATIRQTAAAADLTIEVRDHHEGLTALGTAATVAGMLLAFGVLAMTIGLIRSETSADVRILTATGATSLIRRTLAAGTAGGLALLGALLGTVGAYLGLAARYLDLGDLTPVPVVSLVLILVGVPTLAAGASWLLAGREPPDLARQAIE